MTDFLQVANRAESTLDGGITDTATSMTVVADNFPVVPFHVTLEDEIVRVTEKAGLVFTIVREQEGTTKDAHATGTAVRLHITKAVIKQLQDHEALTTGVHGVGADTVGIMNKDKTIQDTDGDTKIQTEESADEDIIRMDVAGVEAFHLSSTGTLALAKQARARAYPSANQVLPNLTVVRALLDSTDYDIQNELDVSVVSGATTATSTNKLVDSNASFVAGDLNRNVWNTTDNTYAKVTAVDSATQLSLSAHIMVTGENYKLYFSRYTATEAGTYLIVATFRLETLSDGKYAYLYLSKNGATGDLFIARMSAGGTIFGQPLAITVITLSANDYIDFIPYHNVGSNQTMSAGKQYTSLSVARLY